MSEIISRLTEAKEDLRSRTYPENRSSGSQLFSDHDAIGFTDGETGPRGEMLYVDPASEENYY